MESEQHERAQGDEQAMMPDAGGAAVADAAALVSHDHATDAAAAAAAIDATNATNATDATGGTDGLLSRVSLIEQQPLAERAEAFSALYDELRTALDRTDAVAGDAASAAVPGARARPGGHA